MVVEQFRHGARAGGETQRGMWKPCSALFPRNSKRCFIWISWRLSTSAVGRRVDFVAFVWTAFVCVAEESNPKHPSLGSSDSAANHRSFLAGLSVLATYCLPASPCDCLSELVEPTQLGSSGAGQQE